MAYRARKVFGTFEKRATAPTSRYNMFKNLIVIIRLYPEKS